MKSELAAAAGQKQCQQGEEQSRSCPAWSWQQDGPEAQDEHREKCASLLDRASPQAEISAYDQHRRNQL